jgi:hypothetical protein
MTDEQPPAPPQLGVPSIVGSVPAVGWVVSITPAAPVFELAPCTE